MFPSHSSISSRFIQEITITGPKVEGTYINQQKDHCFKWNQTHHKISCTRVNAIIVKFTLISKSLWSSQIKLTFHFRYVSKPKDFLLYYEEILMFIMITVNKNEKWDRFLFKYYSYRIFPTEMSLYALNNGARLTIMRIRTMEHVSHCLKFYQAN